MIALLKEYLHSGDANEARRCLLELEVPHFHHELVYQVTLIIMFLPILPLAIHQVIYAEGKE